MENQILNTLFTTIRDVYLKKATGELTLRYDNGNRYVYIINGNIKYARSDFDSERIGQFLIRDELIEASQLDDLIVKAKESKMILGQYLKNRGYAKADQIRKSVEKLISHIVTKPFSEPPQNIQFMRQQQFIDDNILLDISTAAVLLDGVRGLNNDGFFSDFFEENLEMAPSLAKDSMNLFSELHMSPQEGYIMSRIDGKTTLQNIANMAGMPRDQVTKMLYALHLVGIIYFTEAPDEEVVAPLDEIQSNMDNTGKKVSAVKRDEDFVDDVLDYYTQMDSMNMYQVLGLRNHASVEQVKQSYHSMIKKYHPDKHSSKMYFDIISKLEDIINKISEAYQELNDESKKEKYDRRLMQEAEEKRKSMKVDQKDQIYNDAKMLLNSGNIFNALTMFQRGIQVAPEDKRFHFELGKLYAKKAETHGKAERYLKTVLKMDPSCIDCYLYLARIYKNSGNQDQALRYYSDLLTFDPDNKEAKEFVNNPGGKRGGSLFGGLFGKKK